MIDYLVLNFNRLDETRLCLKSIRENTCFDHKIILLNNGGNDSSQMLSFQKEGLIDYLILNKENEGLGCGTSSLFRFSSSDYVIYFQNDQVLGRNFSEDELNSIKSLMVENDKIGSVSIAGDTNHGLYSERAHVISKKFYNTFPPLGKGGAGPFAHLPWHEEIIQKFYKDNGFIHHVWKNQLVADNGCYSVRQNPDGSIWKHRTDTKELALISGEPKNRFCYPKFNDLEWDYVLQNKTWPNWAIPQNEISHSFVYFKQPEKYQ